MADKQIINLTSGTPVVADVVEFQVATGGAGSSKKATFTAIKTLMSASPTLVTPDLGTPSAGNLQNCTGYPGGALTGLGTGVGNWLATPSSANLAAAVTDETGSGALVFATSPTLVTPNLGIPSAIDLTNGTLLPFQTRVVTGTSDTILATDKGAGVIYTAATAVACTLPNAVSFFTDGFIVTVKAAGAGTVTVASTTALIDGATTFSLPTGMSAYFVSKGGTWYAHYGKQGGGSGGSPGGSDTQVQFNDAGVFGGNAKFTFDKTIGTVTLSGLSLTSSTQAPFINMSGTWNTAGVIQTGVKINVTNTASSASVFANWQENGTSVYSFRVSGMAIAGGSSNGVWGTNQFGDGSGSWGPTLGTSTFGVGSSGGILLRAADVICWTDGTSTLADNRDCEIRRSAAKVIGFVGATTTAGAALEMTEMTAPAAGSTNCVRIYAEDNGSGKTRLMAKFATGAAVQIAIEP